MSLTWWVLGPALLALAMVALEAWRRPILRRMAMRNATRRPAQALAIALGLVVGTAIIAGSLATGDSLTYAVRETAMQAFDHLDVTVGVDGRLYFPASVAEALASDARVAAVTDGIAPVIIEDIAVGHAASGQWEPRAALVAVDPARDDAFGPYATASGMVAARDLQPGEAFLNQRLAQALQAGPGDTVEVRYAQRPDPLLPEVAVHNGTLNVAAGAPAPLPVPGPVPWPAPLPGGGEPPPPYATSPLDEAAFEVEVKPGAARLSLVLAWGSPGDHSDLDLLLEAPAPAHGGPVPLPGQGPVVARNDNGTVGAPDAPAVLNLSQPEPGTWTARVVAKSAVQQDFTLVALVFYEVRDLAQVRAFVERFEDDPRARELVESLTGQVRLQARNLTVRAVALEPGRGGFLNAPDVFVRLDEAQAMYLREGEANLLMVSNPGGPEEGLAGTGATMQALEAALDDLRAAASAEELGLYEGLRPRPLKQEWVEEAERAGALFSGFLTMMGSFSILAGLILIANIFIMLTEERRAELGVARALGLRRADLTRLFLFEGAAYATIAALLGVLLGLLVSYALIAGFNAAWAERLTITLPFRPTSDALLFGFGAGVLMSLVAVASASQRAARLNIERSIRRLEEPDTPLGPLALAMGAAMVAAGAALTWFGFSHGSFSAQVLGPNAALLGLGLLLARFAARSTATRLAGLALVVFNLGTIAAFESPATTEGMVMGPLRGVLLVVGAVMVAVQSRALPLHAAALLARLPKLRPVARIALAYPLHKRLRTGLTVTMFALVIMVVVVFSIFFAVFTPDLVEQSGGFHVAAETTLPGGDLAARLQAASRDAPALQGVADVTSLAYAEVWGGRFVQIDGEPVQHQGPPVDVVYGFGPELAARQDFPLLELHPRFATAREAYAAVLAEPGWVIVSQRYTLGDAGNPGAHHPGDVVTLRTREGPLNLTIAAVQKQVYYGGLWVDRDLAVALFDTLHGYHLIRIVPGADAGEVARAVEATQQELGTDAVSVQEQATRLVAERSRLYGLFEVYLGMGLLLGVASLGIVTARSVLERRQEVGMLRALGLPKAMVVRSFLLEGLFVVTLGSGIGTAMGLVVAWASHARNLAQLGLPFLVPWADLAGILAVAYVATMLATLGPALRAARWAPAEAIRYIE